MLCLLGLTFIATASDYACSANPGIVGPCFELGGRLSFWNGAPSARIWRVGTSRMLGIHYDQLPPGLASQMTSFDTEAWGTFGVCPFTRQSPGRMQSVCIESWRDLRFRERKRE
ncbi:MAG: hypothetical protein E6H66_13125 [Betaproteobacteria bacterium]|nr:MAG: hypothetical protein E6H66_13125 [Betaproteobacteria bacterium]